MNSLDPYLKLFDNISWTLTDGGDLSDIRFHDTELPINADPKRFQELLVPLTTGPIKIYYIADLEIQIVYSPGMSFLDILGAINTFYSSHVSKEFILQNSGKIYGCSGVIDAINNGEDVTFVEFLGDHVYFGGIGKRKDGYFIGLES